MKSAISRIFDATWQRCRVHWIRNALAHVSKGQHTVVAAPIRQAFDQPDRKHAVEMWRHVANQLRARWPKLAELMDESEHDVLAYMAFPRQHRTKLHSTNPIERLKKEVKRRADVVGIFPNEASIMRLIGAVLFEQNDEWQTQNRYRQVKAFDQIDKEEVDPFLSITAKAACSCPQATRKITPSSRTLPTRPTGRPARAGPVWAVWPGPSAPRVARSAQPVWRSPSSLAPATSP